MQKKLTILRNYDWDSRVLIAQFLYCKLFRVKRKDKSIQNHNRRGNLLNKEYYVTKLNKIAACLEHEVTLLKNVRHHNIIKLLDYLIGQENGYLVFEDCEMTLRTHLQNKNGKLSEKETASIFGQIVEGMKELNKNKFIHRDLKPQNIFFKNGIVKISDFGLSIKSTEKINISTLCGLPLYVSPQIIDNVEYSSKTDIWSLGIIMYECIFGYTPWSCRDISSYKKNVRESTLKFPFNIPIGSCTKEFISKCLQIEEEKRFNWNDIFQHPLINKFETGEMSHTYRLDKNSLAIVKRLQSKYLENKELVKSGFEQESYSKQLNLIEFYKGMRKFCKNIGFKQNRQIFQQADTNQDGKVSYPQLIKLLQQYYFEQGEDITNRIITDIKQIIKNKHINTQNLFAAVDISKKGFLDLNSLTRLIQNVAPNIHNYDINKIFQKIDDNMDNMITIEEIQQIFNIHDKSHGKLIESRTQFTNKSMLQSL